MAFGGVTAALAVVIMCLGGLIPLSTYVCPMLAMMILQLVLKSCGGRIAWTWYAAVTVLCMLMGPDKEAVAVFAFLGYYPILKPKLDKLPVRWLWKGIYFNLAISLTYLVLIHLLGMAELAKEFREMGMILFAVTLVLGNVSFFLIDRVLGRKWKRK